MEYSAIFHDMDKRFSYAVDKDLFVIRVQDENDDYESRIRELGIKLREDRKSVV